MSSRLKYALFLPALLVGGGSHAWAPPGFGDWTAGEVIPLEGPPVRMDLPGSDTGFVGTIVIEEGFFDYTGCKITNRMNNSGSSPFNTIGEPIDRIPPRAFIPDTSGDGTVSVIDTLSYRAVGTIPVEASPYGVAIDPRELRAYIGNRGGHSVSVIDTDALEVTATIAIDQAPAGLALDGEGARLLIALESAGAIAAVDTTTLQETTRITVGHPPHDIVPAPDRAVAYVLSRGHAYISVLDLETLEITATVDLADDDHTEPTAIAVNPDGDRVYVVLVNPDQPSSRLKVLDTGTLALDHDAGTFGEAIVDVTVGQDGSSVYLVPHTAPSVCTLIRELDAGSYEDIATHRLPSGLTRALHDGQRFHAISQEHEALIASGGHTLNGVDASFYQVAETGAQPTALGDFIAPLRRPVATPDTRLIEFGGVAPGGNTKRTLNVTNTGNLPLRIYLTVIEEPGIACFPEPCSHDLPDASAVSIVDDSCMETTVEMNGTCTITLQNAPTSNVGTAGRLRLHTNSDASGLSIPFTGTVALSNIAGPGPSEEVSGTTGSPAGGGDTGGGGAFGVTELLLIVLAWLRLRRAPTSMRTLPR